MSSGCSIASSLSEMLNIGITKSTEELGTCYQSGDQIYDSYSNLDQRPATIFLLYISVPTVFEPFPLSLTFTALLFVCQRLGSRSLSKSLPLEKFCNLLVGK